MKKKFVFLGDTNSINIEIINKSHKYLKNKVKYIIIGNKVDLLRYLNKLSSNLKLNEINNPFDFKNLKEEKLNIFNVNNISKYKFKNLLHQIDIANYLSNSLKIDLVTMAIDKSLFKKRINFTGMTEYLAKINNTKTLMLMYGEKFSIIPLTTHINLRNVNVFVKKNTLKKLLKDILSQIKNKNLKLNFNAINFLCYNTHCSENNTLGIEDKIIKETLFNFKEIKGPFAADSAFKKYNHKSLFISMYHDQALIPFKILNQKGINLTMGLDYRRLSPAHGTAKDIKFKNIADISSYVACMEL